MTSVVLTYAETSPWAVPDDWNNATNRIDTIGPGGSGEASGIHSGGGGGGAYAFRVNQSLTGDIPFTVTLGQYLGDLTALNTGFSSPNPVIAKLGGTSTSATGASGGLASACTPTTGAKNGGNGGNAATGPGAGGGAGGQDADGDTGGDGDGGYGGAGNGATNGGGNAAENQGNSGTNLNGTVGSGSGGAHLFITPGQGGDYGGGGSGWEDTLADAGGGAPGVIVITYTPVKHKIVSIVNNKIANRNGVVLKTVSKFNNLAVA